jgi:UDP-N-acetyl-D-glucosamine dehydrogenase
LDARFAKSLNGAKILLIGMAYKKNVADVRESPAFSILELLKRRKAEVRFHDPYVDAIPPTREHAAFTGMASVPLTPEMLRTQEAVIIVTNHDNIDYKMIAENAKLVVDTRNALASSAHRDNIVKA